MTHRSSLSLALAAMLGRLSRLEQELQAILAATQAPTHPVPREYLRYLLGEVELLQALVAAAQATAPRRRVYPGLLGAAVVIWAGAVLLWCLWFAH